MGSKQVKSLGYRQGFAFIGVKGNKKSFVEKRGSSVGANMTIGMARVMGKAI